MKFRLFGFFTSFVLMAGSCSSQGPRVPASPAHYIEIELPSGVASEKLFVRYVLAGDELGGWIQPVAGISSYVINTMQQGSPATGIKAILYAPGCALQTLVMTLSTLNNPKFPFLCQPLGSTHLVGVLVRSDRLFGRSVKVQAKYIPRWAPRFLGLDDGIVIPIPVSDSVLPVNGRFGLTVPDFSADPLAGALDHPGEFQIWAKKATGESIVAQLIPASDGLRTRIGGLKIQSEYFFEIGFAPCVANPAPFHDKNTGFSVRPGPDDSCDR